MKFHCKDNIKLENSEENSSGLPEDSTNSGETVIEVADSVVAESLPCESPILNSWGVAVYGTEVDSDGKPRSASTSINRIEFPDDLSSTLRPVSSSEEAATPTMV